MEMKRGLVGVLLLGMTFSGYAAEKKELDHTCFDAWKSVNNAGLSRDGSWAAYSVDPQEGDGLLYFYNTKTGEKIVIPRGYQASFTADGKWGVALIKPEYAKTRKAKIRLL